MAMALAYDLPCILYQLKYDETQQSPASWMVKLFLKQESNHLQHIK